MNTATATVRSLRNLDATRVGQVHYVHFVAGAEQVAVLTDDCGFEGVSVWPCERADAEYNEYLARGFTPYDYENPARLLRHAP